MARKRKIVAARKDNNVKITRVRFAGNTHFTEIETAIRMAERREIENIHLVHGKTGDFIRSNPDKKKKNNLSEMAKKAKHRKKR